MRRSNVILAAGLFLAAMTTPAWANIPNAPSQGRPGALNYIEGQVSTGGRMLDSKSVGSVELEQGQSIETSKGKAEVLLTPGVFLRLGENTSARMVSLSLTDTAVQIERGRAMVEVDELHPENHLAIIEGTSTTELTKKGLYDFDADRNQVRVFDGHAVLTENGRRVEVKGGHEVNVNAADELKSRGFDKKAYEDDLYRWSSLRSSYLAEANIQQARTYIVDTGWGFGPGWYGAGWYWNPWFSAYTFIPGDGFFYSPFGWGFYSPFYVHRAPYIGFYGGYHTFAHYAPPATFVRGYSGGYAPHGGYVAPRAGYSGGFTGGYHGFSAGGGGFHGGFHR